MKTAILFSAALAASAPQASSFQIQRGKTIATEIHIQAPVETVWRVLTDFGAYPQWNPFIREIAGDLVQDKRISAYITPPDQKGMKFTPKLLAVVPNQELRWLGSLGVPYIFDGEHRFLLIPQADGTTTLHHSERFRGILVPFMQKMLDDNTKRGFEAMNVALKKRCEQP